MRAVYNDALRCLIGVVLRAAGALAEILHRLRARHHRLLWSRLRRRFGIVPETELTTEVPPVDPASDPRRIASTSGTRGGPKLLAYSRRRIASVRWVFVDSFMRAFRMLGVRRTSMYVFGPVEPDGSLSSLLLSEAGSPSYVATLQAPYRMHGWEPLRPLHEAYGLEAVRLWVLTVSNPGVLYSTNPSTMSIFFDALEDDWTRCSALVRDCVRTPDKMVPSLPAATRRIASDGYAQRLKRIAESPTFLPIEEWAPATRVYICWTGGYLAPFLDRLDSRLPASRFRRVPMYSMSTETVETIPDFRLGDPSFLPIAPGVCCEFLEAGVPRAPVRLLAPDELSVGGVYELVISNAHGLRRYCTGDLFRVERFVSDLPDLRFLRRRGLGYSFTGEKLTEAQALLAYERLRRSFADLTADHALTCFPSLQPVDGLPHYRLVVVYPGQKDPGPVAGLAERFDDLLREVNSEYCAKRSSGRLGAVRLERVGLHGLRERLPRGSGAGLDSQFKFLPLYPRLWESSEGDRSGSNRQPSARRGA